MCNVDRSSLVATEAPEVAVTPLAGVIASKALTSLVKDASVEDPGAAMNSSDARSTMRISACIAAAVLRSEALHKDRSASQSVSVTLSSAGLTP